MADSPYRDDDPTRQLRRPGPLRSPQTGRPSVPGLGRPGRVPAVDETQVMPRPSPRPAAGRTAPASGHRGRGGDARSGAQQTARAGAPAETRPVPRPGASRSAGPARGAQGQGRGPQDQGRGPQGQSRSPQGRGPAGGPPATGPAARRRSDGYSDGYDDGFGDGPRSPAGPPRRPAGPARRRRRGRPGLRLVVLLLVAVLVAYPLSLGWTAWRSIERIPAIASSVDTPGTTFLLVGSDSRAGLSDEQVDELATGNEADAGGQRTDTILLLHVPQGSGPSVLVSLPRDSYVAIPGNGENKLNAAYSFGGPQLLVETVEDATGIGIDSYVETGFAGFASVVDALGGVDVCLDAPLTDPDAGIDLPAGCQQLAGPQALGFVRSRKTDATGDLARVQRQRQLLGGIVEQTLSPGLLLDPPTAYRTAGAGGSGLRVDEGTGPLGLGRFVLGMRSVAGADGVQLTVPVSDPDLRTSVGSAVEWDAERSEQLFEALREDDTQQVRSLVAQWTS